MYWAQEILSLIANFLWAMRSSMHPLLIEKWFLLVYVHLLSLKSRLVLNFHLLPETIWEANVFSPADSSYSKCILEVWISKIFKESFCPSLLYYAVAIASSFQPKNYSKFSVSALDSSESKYKLYSNVLWFLFYGEAHKIATTFVFEKSVHVLDFPSTFVFFVGTLLHGYL